MASCGGPSGPSEDDGQSNENVNEQGVPADAVRVMGESARQSVTEFSFDVDDNQGTIRFDPSSDFAQELEAGGIMASRPIEGPAPNGMLQKVESVDEQDDAIVVTTRQATLAEAFERADFEVESLQPGVSFEKRGRGLVKPVELNFEEVPIDADGDEGTTDNISGRRGPTTFRATDGYITTFQGRRRLADAFFEKRSRNRSRPRKRPRARNRPRPRKRP
jgi:hypothetical protein